MPRPSRFTTALLATLLSAGLSVASDGTGPAPAAAPKLEIEVTVTGLDPGTVPTIEHQTRRQALDHMGPFQFDGMEPAGKNGVATGVIRLNPKSDMFSIRATAPAPGGKSEYPVTTRWHQVMAEGAGKVEINIPLAQ